MRLFRPITVILSLLIIGSFNVHAKDELLKSDDVKTVMRRIFEYHVDAKRITPEILRRSLKVYIDQFDSERLYLTESEIAPFLRPSRQLMDRLMTQYHQGELGVYAELDRVIQGSIRRSRELRGGLEADVSGLFEDESDLPARPRYPKRAFANSIAELKNRIEERLLRFIHLQKKKLEEGEVEGLEDKVLSLYERNLRASEDKYLDIDETGRPLSPREKEHILTLRTLKALAKSLDSHTAFFSAQEAYDMRVRLEKGFHGIGIVLQEGIEGVSVVRLIEGGPAEKSGLVKAKDRIIEIDGTSVEGAAFDTVLDMIRGKEGSVVVLGLVRETGGSKRVVNVELRRERITMNDSRVDVSYEEVEGGVIGKLTLHSFYDGENGISSERDIRNGIRELYQKGNVKGLVLDLRENTGGFLMQAVKVAGLFITNGVVVISKYSDGEVRYFRDIDGHAYYDGPLIILTSKASASAAEIVAQTLQDYGAALIVGDQRTYGKGSIQHQTVTGRESDSFFKVTVGRYYTVSGRSTQIHGVQADIVVPSQFSGEQIGEKFLDFPLSYGATDPAFNDKLSDIDQAARRWYLKYYMPSLQAKRQEYQSILPVLQERSKGRLQGDTRYQAYLNFAKGDDPSSGEEEQVFEELMADPESMDPPMEEAVNIMRDMMLLLPNTGSMDKIFSEG